MPPEFWIGSCCLIEPAKGYYAFDRVPQYWDFLEKQAQAGVIGCPEPVLKELEGDEPGKSDTLEVWAKALRSILFVEPEQTVQVAYAEIANAVQQTSRFKQQHIAPFLAKADCWVIAYARVHGGKIVTSEKPEPLSSKPKIPDVARTYNIRCVPLWDMLNDLGFRA
jgi:hypothetical protein